MAKAAGDAERARLRGPPDRVGGVVHPPREVGQCDEGHVTEPLHGQIETAPHHAGAVFMREPDPSLKTPARPVGPGHTPESQGNDVKPSGRGRRAHPFDRARGADHQGRPGKIGFASPPWFGEGGGAHRAAQHDPRHPGEERGADHMAREPNCLSGAGRIDGALSEGAREMHHGARSPKALRQSGRA